MNRSSALQQTQQDFDRYWRIAKHYDYKKYIENSPVQNVNSYMICDKESDDIFICFEFHNFSNRSIYKLDIELILYDHSIFPYHRIFFTYSNQLNSFGTRLDSDGNNLKFARLKKGASKDYINPDEQFGRMSLIKLPSEVFTKAELKLISVEFKDGTKTTINEMFEPFVNEFAKLTNLNQFMYYKNNKFQHIESIAPTSVFPIFGKYSQSCCCGTPNLHTDVNCRFCGRELKWVSENVTHEAFEQNIENASTNEKSLYSDKSNFSQMKYMQSESDIVYKKAMFEKSIKNIEKPKIMFEEVGDEDQIKSKILKTIARIFIKNSVYVLLVIVIILYLLSRR